MLRAWSRWLCEISKASTCAISWPCPSRRCRAWLPLIPASNTSRTPRAWTKMQFPLLPDWREMSFMVAVYQDCLEILRGKVHDLGFSPARLSSTARISRSIADLDCTPITAPLAFRGRSAIGCWAATFGPGGAVPHRRGLSTLFQIQSRNDFLRAGGQTADFPSQLYFFGNIGFFDPPLNMFHLHTAVPSAFQFSLTFTASHVLAPADFWVTKADRFSSYQPPACIACARAIASSAM
jgi:hypothetical protein